MIDLPAQTSADDVLRGTDAAAVDAGRARRETVEGRELQDGPEIEVLVFEAGDHVGPAALVHDVFEADANVPAVPVLGAGVVELRAGHVRQPRGHVGDCPAAVTVQQEVVPGPTQAAARSEEAVVPDLAGNG